MSFRLLSVAVATALLGSGLSANATLDRTEAKSGLGYSNERSSTALKLDVPLQDTPRNVVSLNQDLLEQTQSGNVGEAFDYIAGITTTDSSDRRFQARGDKKININNVLVDGLRINQAGDAGTGTRFPGSFNAQSIEVLFGPSGVLYGAGNGFATVNVVTKKPLPYAAYGLKYGYKAFASEDTGYLSKYGFWYGADATGPLREGVNYRAIVEHRPSQDMFQDHRKLDEFFATGMLSISLDDTLELLPSVTFTKLGKTSASSYGDAAPLKPQKTEMTDPATGKIERQKKLTIAPANADTPNRSLYYGGKDDWGEEQMIQAGLLVKKRLGDGWELKTRLSAKSSKSDIRDLEFRKTKIYTYQGKNYLSRQGVRAAANSTFVGFDGGLGGEYTLAGLTQKSLIGLSYALQDVEFSREYEKDHADEKVFDIDVHGKNNFIEVGNPRNAQKTLSSTKIPIKFGGDKTSSSSDLNLYGMQHLYVGDFIASVGATQAFSTKVKHPDGRKRTLDFSGLSTNGALVYKLGDSTSLYASVSNAFEPHENMKIDKSVDEDNPPKDWAKYVSAFDDPKRTVNYELGFKMSSSDGRYALGANVFNMRVLGELDDGTELEIEGEEFYAKQIDSALSRGLEMQSQFHAHGLSALVSYSYVNAVFDADFDDFKKGDRRGLVSPHSLALWSTYKLTPKLKLGMGIKYASSKLANDEKSGDDDYKALELPAQFEMDLSAYYQLYAHTKLSLMVKNALDDKRMDHAISYTRAKANTPRRILFEVAHSF